MPLIVENGACGALGGKASWLAKLAAAGLPVPRFAVLAHGRALPPGDELATEAARRGLRFPLIARSSAVGEDSASASFAGMFESAVAREPGELAGAVARVRASLSAPHVREYARSMGLAAPAEMHVVLQEFVRADWYGVYVSLGAEEHLECSREFDGTTSGDGDVLCFSSPFDGLPEGLSAALAACRAARAAFAAGGCDVEWASVPGRAWVLQYRPLSVAA